MRFSRLPGNKNPKPSSKNNLFDKKNRGHILVTQPIPPTGVRLKGECTDKKNKFKETNIQNKKKPENKIDYNSKYDVHMD